MRGSGARRPHGRSDAGPRRDFRRVPLSPHNVPLVLVGAGLLWFGWFGFNPGSTLNATSLHFADVVITTNLAAAAGAIAAMACGQPA